MNESNNIKLVKQIYDCYLRKDYPGILNHLSEQIIFKEPPKGKKPFADTYRGRKGVAEFFRKVEEVVEFISYEAEEFFAEDNTVIVIGHYKASSKLNGKEWESDMVEVWRIENSLVIEYQVFRDSAAELISMPKELAY